MKTLTAVATTVITGLVLTGQALAANYTIDPAHSTIGFNVKHMMVSNVTGGFGQIEGTVSYDANTLKDFKAQTTLQVASIDTRVKQRDDHLKSAEFFDAAKYPTITFVSKSLTGANGQYVLTGDLTIKDVTKEVSFPVNIAGPVKSPFGTTVIGITGQLTINRQDYNVSFNKNLDNGGLLVANDVNIVINIEANQ